MRIRGFGVLVAVVAQLTLGPANATAISFVAQLDPDQVVPIADGIDPSGVSQASGTALFELNEAQDRLDYSIELVGLSIIGDLQGMHLHIGAPGANGPHVLNILGLPSQDDSDVVIDTINNVVSGSYDDTDENFDAAGTPGVRDPGDSVKLTSVIDELLLGNFYIAVHSSAFPLPNTSELRGQVTLVPEPSTVALLALGLCALVGSRLRG